MILCLAVLVELRLMIETDRHGRTQAREWKPTTPVASTADAWHRAVKTECWVAGMVICLERGADLHMAQLMPLPLTVLLQ